MESIPIRAPHHAQPTREGDKGGEAADDGADAID
jgi:hypothetical protein